MTITRDELLSAPVKALTRAEVMALYKVSAWFMRTHKAAMGGRGKPALYDALLVEEFFREYFRGQALLDLKAHEATDAVKRDIARVISGACADTAAKVRPIRPRKVA